MIYRFNDCIMVVPSTHLFIYLTSLLWCVVGNLNYFVEQIALKIGVFKLLNLKGIVSRDFGGLQMMLDK